MHVEIHDGATVIATVIVEHLDPLMGVAFGPLSPLPGYDPGRHAALVDGVPMTDLRQLHVTCAAYGRLEGVAISITEGGGPGLEREATLWFEDHRAYAAVFSDHPDYRRYHKT